MTWCRGVLVAAVWLVWLPWCMRVVWRTLFWLGDGGWSQDLFALPAETTEPQTLSLAEMERVRSAVQAAKETNTTQNLTLSKLLMSISYSPANATTTSFFWTFAQRVLLGFPYPFAQIAQIAQLAPFSTADLNITSSNSTSDGLGSRSPSLLSDIPFFNWFQSQTMNRFIIDVLEGQIITLFVVVAFILIFLIREWVVQQQPVMNLVAMGEQAAAPREANQENAVQLDVLAEEQEEEVEDDEEEEEEEEEEDVDAENGLFDDIEEEMEDYDEHVAPEPTIRRVRRSSSLRRRREETLPKTDSEDFPRAARKVSYSGAHRDLDSMFSTTDFAESSRQGSSRTTSSTDMARKRSDTPVIGNSQHVVSSSKDLHVPTSSGPAVAKQDGNVPNTLDAALDDAGVESSSSIQRPNMPARDRSFIATEIRRSLEEGQTWSFDKIAHDSGKSAQQSDDAPDWQSDPEEGPVSHQAPESENSSDSWQQVPDVIAEDDSNQALEGEPSQDKGKAKVVHDIPVHANTTASAHDELSDTSDGIRLSLEKEEDISSNQSERGSDLPSESSNTDETHPVPEDPAATAPLAPAEVAQAPQDTINLILDWLFGDVVAAPQPAEEAGNDEQVVRNVADEAPFVPFVENERRENVPRIQDPEVAAAAAQAGIDLNDQEAIDDAEDLEGILELIGMQGPLIGLFQNVLFSEVLISATLAAAVWLPYLWGKVVILFMGSPIALFIKLPLQLVATMTDLIADTTLVVVAGLTFWGSRLIAILVKFCSFGKLSKAVEGPLRTISNPAASLANSAMDRIFKLLVDSPLSPRPDYFRLSINSHAALRRLQNSTSFALNETGNFATTVFEKASADSPPRLVFNIITCMPNFVQTTFTALSRECNTLFNWLWTSKSFKITFNVDLGGNTAVAYNALERWTATDRIIAILAGYGFFALAGAVYLKRGTPFSTSQQGQKIERIISDILQQAGGVLKVILIISIEMLAFPLYCGLLLDLATLPLFKNATLLTRWHFATESPWTSGFVHWFVGTCYMFHFALFVSMCRKIMRKGVLYFIRDPDDPTFHPVRDVLERSVTTQLRKIAFSALVYGALVIVCLGGVVWSLSRATSKVLPIHWTTEAPSLEFPLDLLFYNFLTPVIIKFYKPSETLHAIYKWWFKTCASFLRLSNFLFGDKVKEQEGSDGKYVRAPASDQARIPKGQPVFVEVDADNVRKDGQTEGGVHNSDLVTMVYIPSWFRVRIFAFVVTIWIFMGFSGLSVTILPLLFGRYLFSLFLPPTVEMNDIHAFSLGIYVLGSLAYSGFHVYKFIQSLNRPLPDPMSTFHTVLSNQFPRGAPGPALPLRLGRTHLRHPLPLRRAHRTLLPHATARLPRPCRTTRHPPDPRLDTRLPLLAPRSPHPLREPRIPPRPRLLRRRQGRLSLPQCADRDPLLHGPCAYPFPGRHCASGVSGFRHEQDYVLVC